MADEGVVYLHLDDALASDLVIEGALKDGAVGSERAVEHAPVAQAVALSHVYGDSWAVVGRP